VGNGWISLIFRGEKRKKRKDGTKLLNGEKGRQTGARTGARTGTATGTGRGGGGNAIRLIEARWMSSKEEGTIYMHG